MTDHSHRALIVASLALMALAPAEVPIAADSGILALPRPGEQPEHQRPTFTGEDFLSLRTRATEGDAEAAAELGQMYARGWPVRRDIDEAFRWLGKAVEGGSTLGRREFGLLLLRLPEPHRDPARAIPMLRAAAEAGDAEAQATLGMLHTWGDGVAFDAAAAMEWTLRAAEQDDRWALANVGLLLELGAIGPKDPATAAYWYQRAADRGSPAGVARLASLYQRGSGVARDPDRAFTLALRAAQDDDPLGQRLLALAYREGWGVAANLAESFAWLKHAAEQGDAEAAFMLVDALDQGRGVPRDRVQAWSWLLRAGESGHAIAAAWIGLAYSSGTGIPTQDYAEAARWLGLALQRAGSVSALVSDEQGTPRAQTLALARYGLGALLLMGNGTAMDPERARGLFEEAAAVGNAAALAQLGWMYHAGMTVPVDDTKATELLRQAAEKGSGPAAVQLGDGFIAGWAGRTDAAEAARWYRVGAVAREPAAWLALGRAYEGGRGVPQDLAEALVWYKMAAATGLPAAQTRMGDVAYFGQLGQPRDDAAALAWYRAAVGQGHEGARYMLGVRSEERVGAGFPNTEAVALFRQSANAGWRNAMHRLGDAYRDGTLGLTQDEAQAVGLYRRAAALGSVGAEFNLAVMIEHGRGTERDPEAAIVIYREAAEHGSPNALNRLGAIARNGELGRVRDDIEALRQFQLAALAGFPEGQANLASMLENGSGTDRDPGAALVLWRKAADQGLNFALNRLGNAAREGALGMPPDDAEAVRLYRRAADAGMADARANLAFMLETGRGADRDPDAALTLLRQAADQGSAYARNRLGAALQNGGLGLPPDDREALRWYRLAAEQDYVDAAYNLGWMYLYGRGTDEDAAQAEKWYGRAAALGNLRAEAALGDIAWFGMAGRTQDRAEAVKHYHVAAEGGIASAQYMLSLAYRLGQGVIADESQMFVWARKAAEQGHGDALNSVGFSILSGVNGSYDYVEAASWLILAVERITVEAERQRAQVNLANAMVQLDDTERAEAETRAATWRAKFPTKS